MDTSNFGSIEDEFPVLDLIGRYAFKTRASISFHLGKYSEELVLGDGSTLSVPHFIVLGWIDVHHPCDHHIKTQLLCSLPAGYNAREKQKAIVETLLAALGIPADETYEAKLFHAEQVTLIEQTTDRDGMTDRLY